MHIIDMPGATTITLIYVDALRRLVDQQLGYPKAPAVPDPTDPNIGWTWTCSQPALHPTDKTRWGLPVTDEMYPWVVALLGQYRQKVTDGTANINEQALAALPDPIERDASWGE